MSQRFAGALLLALLLFVPRSVIGAPRPPNIVLIIADDQMWTDYGFMGHPHIETPHLDQLATQGLWFPRGYVPASLCRPSLATLVTGLYPHQHRLTGNEPPIPAGGKKDPAYARLRRQMIASLDRVPVLARLLGDHGYVSHQSGKWWEGNYRRGGFTAGMTRGYPHPGGRHGDAGLSIGRDGMRPILDFIDGAGEKPFLIYYAPFLPHRPHTPPKRLVEKYLGKTPSRIVARYWAMCEWLDETCGVLLAHLEKRGLVDDTLVIFISDNGWIQNPERPGYAPRSKRSAYDGGVRTPILMRWPKHVKPARIDTPVSSIDILPTILAAAGVKRPDGLPGIDLRDAAAVAGREIIFGEVFLHNAVDIREPARNLLARWCIQGRWKLIVPDATNFPGGRIELFDLDKDPHEQTNLAEKHPSTVKTLRARLDAWWSGAARRR